MIASHDEMLVAVNIAFNTTNRLARLVSAVSNGSTIGKEICRNLTASSVKWRFVHMEEFWVLLSDFASQLRYVTADKADDLWFKSRQSRIVNVFFLLCCF